MANRCISYSLVAVYGLAIVLSSAHAVVVKRSPASSFKIDLVHVPQTETLTGDSYAVPVKVGDTEMNLHLDSANMATWVLSDLLPKDQYPNHDKKYPVGDKAKCPAPSIGFDDGVKIDGQLVDDSVKIGDIGFVQTFTAAEKINPEDPLCAGSSIAGNIGFAYESASWVKSAYAKGLINSVFAFEFGTGNTPKAYLSLAPSEAPEDTKWYDRWEDDEDYPDNLWTFEQSEDVPYLMDAGAQVLYQPLDIARNYYQNADFAKVEEIQDPKEPDKRYYMVGCDEKMPDFKMKLGEIDITVNGEDLKGIESEENKGWCDGKLIGYDNTWSEDDLDKNLYFTIGVPAMKQIQVYFDMKGDGRIGFRVATDN